MKDCVRKYSRCVAAARPLAWVLARRAMSCALAAVCAGAALGMSSAAGAVGHQYASRIVEASMGSDLLSPASVAVDRSSGRVFVADPLAGYVDVYTSSGEYVAQFGGGALDAVGVAVSEASGLVYVANAPYERVAVFAPDAGSEYRLVEEWSGKETPGKEFTEVTGIAVNNATGPAAGDVYVVQARAGGVVGGVVDVFRPEPVPEEGEGTLVTSMSGSKLEGADGVAVSASTGQVLVADSAKGAVYVYNATGGYEAKLNGKGSPYGAFVKEMPVGDVAGVAVDEASGDIYVAEAERHAVSQYTASGEWDGWITDTPGGELGEPRGVALTSSGEVFVADAGAGDVDLFGPGMVVPSVETGEVAKSDLTRTSALLAGTVDGDGETATYRFQYGETEALGTETVGEKVGAGSEPVAMMIEKLHAGTVYFYRIVGEDNSGASYGAIREFETPPAVEGLETGPAVNGAPGGVTLTGSLKRGGVVTHYSFQYGTTEAYGQRSPEPPMEVPPGSVEKEERQSQTVQTTIITLSPNTLYHYRLVGQNDDYGTTYGADRTFTTSGPPRISYEPTGGVGQEEATMHAEIDPDELATSYRFQYGETSAYGGESPMETAGSGGTPVPVAATLSHLKIGTTYHFRLLAENEAGVTVGSDETLTTVPPAPVETTYATNVTASEATLHTKIDPLGHDTRYYFQYGTQSCAPSPDACIDIPAPPGEDIGTGDEAVPGEVNLNGLTPGTTYHYRVLDSNSLGITEGPEHTFATQQPAKAGAFALPDDRAWEMVSPPDKGGAPVEALTREGGIILASTDGSTLTYVVNGALGEAVQGNRSPEMQQVLANRSPSRWRSEDIATPNAGPKGLTAGLAPEYQYFTPDLTDALVEPAELSSRAEPPLAPGVTEATVYVRNDLTDAYTPVVTEANTAPGTRFGGRVHFLSATPDLRHVVIASEVGLTGASGVAGIYEWSAGPLRLASVLPTGRPAPGARGEVEFGFFNRVLTNAISSDGSRIIWTKKEENSGRGHLYLRDTVRGETVQLDAAKEGISEPAKGSAEFQAASSDDSRILFTDRQRLTRNATTEVGQAQTPGKPDLYECEIVEEEGKLACDLSDLTVDRNEGEHAAVQGLLFGANEDASNLYFVAQGVLASNANSDGQLAVAGADNLYEARYDGGGWATIFIASLSSEDSPEWTGGALGDRAFLTARVSPNGDYLAFMSAASVTSYDNVDAKPEAKGAHDEEVYLYDSVAGTLTCVSCNPSGARPSGVRDQNEAGEGDGLLVDRRKVWGEPGHEHWLAGNIPGWTAQSLSGALYQPRYLTDEGRLFFNSPDDLVPAASNHKEDVYEYEPSGIGSCESSTGGCVALLSSGASSRESAFLEATPDGGSVFFLTDAQLLPQDTDTAFDLYDARVCTAQSPCQTIPHSPPGGCEEVLTCRPASPAAQISGGPAGSATFSGPGDPQSAPQPHVQVKGKQVAKKPTAKHLTRKQELARALSQCRHRYAHSKPKRGACERSARKRYRPNSTKKQHAKRTPGGNGRKG